MHLVECRFAAPFWTPYVQDQDVERLKDIAKELLGCKNKNGKTPILKLLESPNPNFKATSKLFNLKLIKDKTFESIEDEIYKGFTGYFVKQY